MSKRILELRRQQSEILTEARTISDKAGGEKRALAEAEASRFDELMGEADAFQKDIEREERAGSFAAAQQQGEDDPNRLGMGEGEVRAYSLTRAIRAAANHATGQRDAWKEAGLELEASQAVAKRMGRDPQGFFVPMDVQERRSPERRDLNVTTGSAGGDMVATDLLADSFIDLLRNRMVVRQAGATVLTGLQGDIAIPRQTGGATAYWVAESGAPTESQQTVDQVTLTPKTVGAYTDFSRKLLKQSSMDVERFVRADLTNVIALAIDLAALHGTGASNQPTGIAATSGIGSVAGGTNGLAPAWAHIVGLETEVAIDNADIGRLAYMTNAKVRGKAKQTPKVASTDSMMLWDTQSNAQPLNGYGAFVTNQVSSALTKGTASAVCSAIFFGNWADLVIGMWGTLDILVDPYTGATSGTVRVVALEDMDIAVRHAESFAAMLDALTT